MKRYEEYNDIGILGMPNVPSHWSKVRNKTFLKVTGELVGDRKDEFPLLSLTTKGVILRDIDSGKGKFPKEFDTYQVVKKDDLVFCLFDIDETPRTVGLVDVEGMITGAYTALSVDASISLPKFVYYFYLWIDDIKGLKPYYSGLRKTVRADKFLMLYIPLPPLAEQEKIVRFLESKTLCIDAYVAERERELQLLNELKESEIANIVTRGLNPDVKMKDSRIPWLDSIPEHWGEERAKYLFNRENRPISDDDDIITCFRDGQVTLRKNRRTTGFTESFKECGYQGIRKGDLVIHQMDAFAGSVGISDSDGKGTPVYIVCTPKRDDVYNPYFALVIREMGLNGYIQSLYRGIRERSSDFKFDVFRQQCLPLPPIEEQIAIVSHIEGKVNKVNSLISELEAEIEYLKEYKQKLIADCVTGQIDVQSEI